MPDPALTPAPLPALELAPGAACKIIGLGGVGGIVTRYAAMYLASLAQEIRLVLIDGDTFEPGNASRMFFGHCGNKAAVVRDELLPRFTDSTLTLVAIEEYVTPDNLERLIRDGDLVILAVDNHHSRRMVSEWCGGLDTVTLLSGGNDGVGPDGSGKVRRGTYGNVQVYQRSNGQDLTPPLTQYHPEIANPVDHNPAERSCTELVASVPQILFANLLVASALLNTLWLLLQGKLTYHEIAFDLADGLMRPVHRIGTKAPNGGE